MKKVRYIKELDEIEVTKKSRIITIREWYVVTSMELLRHHLNSEQLSNYLTDASASLLESLKVPDEMIMEEE